VVRGSPEAAPWTRLDREAHILERDMRRIRAIGRDRTSPDAGIGAAITAAVVGVILSLAIWFGLHVLFADVTTLQAGPLKMEVPALSSVDWASLVLTLLAVLAVFRLKMSVMTVLFGTAVLGMTWTLAGMR